MPFLCVKNKKAAEKAERAAIKTADAKAVDAARETVGMPQQDGGRAPHTTQDTDSAHHTITTAPEAETRPSISVTHHFSAGMFVFFFCFERIFFCRVSGAETSQYP